MTFILMTTLKAIRSLNCALELYNFGLVKIVGKGEVARMDITQRERALDWMYKLRS